jgi:fructose-1-phosphate kinase PfkB-like protein
VRNRNTLWFPPYCKPHDPKIIQNTGAGNTFLGGFLIALQQGESIERALIYGSVAASFALEQIGIPKLNLVDPQRELWNISDVLIRVQDYKSSLAPTTNMTT